MDAVRTYIKGGCIIGMAEVKPNGAPKEEVKGEAPVVETEVVNQPKRGKRK